MSRALEIGQVHSRCGEVLTAETLYVKPSNGGRSCRVCANKSCRDYGKKNRDAQRAARADMRAVTPTPRRQHLTPAHEPGEGVAPFFESAPYACTRALAVAEGNLGWQAQVVRRDKKGRVTVVYRSRERFTEMRSAFAHAEKVLEERTA